VKNASTKVNCSILLSARYHFTGRGHQLSVGNIIESCAINRKMMNASTNSLEPIGVVRPDSRSLRRTTIPPLAKLPMSLAIALKGGNRLLGVHRPRRVLPALWSRHDIRPPRNLHIVRDGPALAVMTDVERALIPSVRKFAWRQPDALRVCKNIIREFRRRNEPEPSCGVEHFESTAIHFVSLFVLLITAAKAATAAGHGRREVPLIESRCSYSP
jgi:hypothetical protein